MPTCSFFGHRDCPGDLNPLLKYVILDLIATHGVDMFYVGHQGGFDDLVRGVLRELEQEYSEVRYAVVLAYTPSGAPAADTADTMLPEGIELVHPRYAISWRNNWMLQQSDFVIAYVAHSWGGAARYMQKAIRSGKIVINLFDSEQGGRMQ
jgi:uncharacterized phage-like protein YoqJ